MMFGIIHINYLDPVNSCKFPNWKGSQSWRDFNYFFFFKPYCMDDWQNISDVVHVMAFLRTASQAQKTFLSKVLWNFTISKHIKKSQRKLIQNPKEYCKCMYGTSYFSTCISTLSTFIWPDHQQRLSLPAVPTGTPAYHDCIFNWSH